MPPRLKSGPPHVAQTRITAGEWRGRVVSTPSGREVRPTRAMVRHGFFDLNLHRIYCGTAASNVGMNRLALAMGMQQEGVRRSHLFLEGEWVDVIEYGVLRTEFGGAVG